MLSSGTIGNICHAQFMHLSAVDYFAGSPQSMVVVLFADQMQISSKPLMC